MRLHIKQPVRRLNVALVNELTAGCLRLPLSRFVDTHCCDWMLAPKKKCAYLVVLKGRHWQWRRHSANRTAMLKAKLSWMHLKAPLDLGPSTLTKQLSRNP